MSTPHPYYQQRRPAIAADFEASLDLASAEFEKLLPSKPLQELKPRLFEELDRVLTTLPYVGGASGRMTPFFEQAAGFFALGRVLRSDGVPMETTATLMRASFMAKLMSLPPEQRVALGEKWLSPDNQAVLRVVAAASKDKENPGDFVYQFVEPGRTEDGESFDFGLDYSECGFCKLCKANGDEELLPVMCAMDKESYGLRGVELFRSTTLANGADRCNFRFRALKDNKGTKE